MALPMDEQRILEEMERMLAAEDPRLAARLAAFGRPGFGHVLRTRRARATLALMSLALVGAVAMVIYLVGAFRLSAEHGGNVPHGTRSAQQAPGSSASTGRSTASQQTTTPSKGVSGPTQRTTKSGQSTRSGHNGTAASAGQTGGRAVTKSGRGRQGSTKTMTSSQCAALFSPQCAVYATSTFILP